MLAIGAMIIFIIAAILSFLKIWTMPGVIGLGLVGLAALALHLYGSWGGPYVWRRTP